MRKSTASLPDLEQSVDEKTVLRRDNSCTVTTTVQYGVVLHAGELWWFMSSKQWCA